MNLPHVWTPLWSMSHRRCSFAYLLPYLCSIPWPGLYAPYGSRVISVLVELVLSCFIKCRRKRRKIKLNIPMKTIAIRTHRIISFQSVRIFISPRLYSMYHIVCSYCVLNLLWVFKALYHKSFMKKDVTWSSPPQDVAVLAVLDFSNYLLQSWRSYFISQKFAHQPRSHGQNKDVSYVTYAMALRTGTRASKTRTARTSKCWRALIGSSRKASSQTWNPSLSLHSYWTIHHVYYCTCLEITNNHLFYFYNRRRCENGLVRFWYSNLHLYHWLN